MSEKQELSQEEVISLVENQNLESYSELKDNLLPHLGHSEAKRLLLAIMAYPRAEQSMEGEKLEMIQAFSACKRIMDGLVALGVEVVIQQMIQNNQQQENDQNVDK